MNDDDYTERIIYIKERAQRIEAFLRDAAKKREFIECSILSIEQDMGNKKAEHGKILKEVETIEKSIEVMKMAVELMAEKGIKVLEGILTEGLHAIFDDRNYSVKIEIDERGSVKTAEIILVEEGSFGRRETPLKDAVGAGVQTIVGLLLRVYFILVLKMRRFMVMDESLFAVSTVYLSNLFSFISQLKRAGFEFLIISHDPRVMEYADHVYSVTMGEVSKIK